jgi:flagellar basal-body rod protein FlgB
MIHDILFNQNADVLLRLMLDTSAARQRVIASNIAHVSTPGYKRLGVSFGIVLNKVQQSSNKDMSKSENARPPFSSDDIVIHKPKIVEVEDNYWNGVNNINIDQEMADLAKNQLDFEIAARLVNERFTQLKTAIRGRR